MKKYIFVVILGLFFLDYSLCYTFRWDMSTNVIYRVKSFVKQNIYTNNVFARYVEIMNKASLESKRLVNMEGINFLEIEGDFYVFDKDYDKDTEFRLEEILKSRYFRDTKGRMIIDPKYLMPVSRNIPVFPKEDLNVGEEWSFPAHEVHKVGFKELFDVIRVDFTPKYKFLYVTNISNENLAVLEIKYAFSKSFKTTKILSYLSGSSETLYYWSLSRNLPYFMKENYFFNLMYKDGFSVVYSGTSEGWLEYVQNWTLSQKQEIVKDISNSITIQGVEIKVGESEINISLPEILFDFNDYKIKPTFKEILKNFYDSIKQHKNIDIIVEGHTDDIGDEDYNLKLSEMRAKEVAKELISLGLEKERISYKGYGKSKPKVPNVSPENRSKNRRVEIKVIWGK